MRFQRGAKSSLVVCLPQPHGLYQRDFKTSGFRGGFEQTTHKVFDGFSTWYQLRPALSLHDPRIVVVFFQAGFADEHKLSGRVFSGVS